MTRLDQELVRRGLAPSRTRAAELVSAGRVLADGATSRRPAETVSAETPLRVRPPVDGRDYVSRGGTKLEAALRLFRAGPAPLEVTGKRCLDAGASTGGFTDALLHAGAAHVAAVDVGHDQLAPALRADARVTAFEGTTVRDLDPAVLGGPVDLTVADLSFISLTLVLPALVGCTRTAGNLVLLVKPQFEVGRERLARGGVVRDPELRAGAVRAVAAAGRALGLRVRGLVRSPVTGEHGNVEQLLWLAGTGPELDLDPLLPLVVGSAG